MSNGNGKAQPGLALRMQRETRVISAQHRQLDDFYLRVASAVHGDQPDAARAAFARFADALEAHLALEDGLYFPALRGLRPALGRDLEALCDEHQQLREGLAGVARLIDVFGRQSIHVVVFDDFVSDTSAAYEHLCHYLGIDASFRPDFDLSLAQRAGSAVTRSGRLARLLWRPRPVIARAARALLPHGARRALRRCCKSGP